MFTGTLPPISAGETYQETLELVSDDDGTPVQKTFLDACAIEVSLFAQGCSSPLMAGSATCPQDGILTISLPSTDSLSGVCRLRVRLTKDGVTDDVLDAALPIQG